MRSPRDGGGSVLCAGPTRVRVKRWLPPECRSGASVDIREVQHRPPASLLVDQAAVGAVLAVQVVARLAPGVAAGVSKDERAGDAV